MVRFARWAGWALVAAACCAFLSLARAQDTDAAMVESGAIKIPASRVWKIEKAFLAGMKEAQPDTELSAEERLTLRRQIALSEYNLELVTKLARETQAALPPDALKAELADFQKELEKNKLTMESFLGRRAKTQAEFEEFFGAQRGLEKQQRATLTDKDLTELFEKVSPELKLRRCSHILYMYKDSMRSTATRSKDEAIKKAQDAVAKLRTDLKGLKLEDAQKAFGDLATKESDCPSKERGGDLNYSARKGEEAMVPEFAEALYKLAQPGDLSDVVETPFGFHVIWLQDVRDLNFYKDQLTRELVTERIDKLIQAAQKGQEPKLNDKLLEQLPPGEKAPPPGEKKPAPALKLPPGAE